MFEELTKEQREQETRREAVRSYLDAISVDSNMTQLVGTHIDKLVNEMDMESPAGSVASAHIAVGIAILLQKSNSPTIILQLRMLFAHMLAILVDRKLKDI